MQPVLQANGVLRGLWGPGLCRNKEIPGSRVRGRKNESGCQAPSSAQASRAVPLPHEGCKLLDPPAHFVVKAKCLFLSCNSQRL